MEIQIETWSIGFPFVAKIAVLLQMKFVFQPLFGGYNNNCWGIALATSPDSSVNPNCFPTPVMSILYSAGKTIVTKSALANSVAIRVAFSKVLVD